MARLNRNHNRNRDNQATAPQLTVHEDSDYGSKESDSDPQLIKSRSRRTRSKKASTVINGNSSDEKSDGVVDDGAMSARFSSIRLNGQRQEVGSKKSRQQEKENTSGKEDILSNSEKSKTRRALGSTQANPLLLPLPSTSAQKGRYSLENVENFRPKSASWREDEGNNLVSSSSSSKDGRRRGEPERTLSKSPRKTGTTARIEKKRVSQFQLSDDENGVSGGESDSLDDFIVEDDEDISYIQDSDEELEEDEEEPVVEPKTPRRLFKGTRPESARVGRADMGNNTTGHSSSVRANVLQPEGFQGRDQPSAFLNLQPITYDKEIAGTEPTITRSPFKGTQLVSARHDRTGIGNNTTDHSSSVAANVLHPRAFEKVDQSFALLDLQPTTYDKSNQDTPVKKPQADTMEPAGGPQDRPAKK